MNKLFRYFYLSVGLLASLPFFAQNPSVASMGSFEEYPVDLFTGAVNVSVPIYSMPTRSQDIQIGISLNYHPSSVSEFNKNIGDTGKGWSLNYGGIVARNIIRNPDEATVETNYEHETDDYYYFNFFGYSGKFKPSGNVGVLIENKGPELKIDIEYDSSSKIVAFKFYDGKGYMYRFAAVDKAIFITYDVRNTINVSFQLTEIYDTNNMPLVTYLYTEYSKTEPYHINNEANKYQIIDKINVPGYGEIEIANEELGDRKTFTDILVKDFLGNPVRKCVFFYNYNIIDYPQLTEIDVSDYNDVEVQIYKMYYNTLFNPTLFNPLIEGTDEWGYPNRTHEQCTGNDTYYVSKIADPNYCYKGVLEKMTLPTGGCVIYNYEANTYSYEGATSLEEEDPNAFTKFTYPQNVHNYSKSVFAHQDFHLSTQPPFSFVVQQNNTAFYIEYHGLEFDTGFNNTDGSPVYDNPKFKIFKDGIEIYMSENPNPADCHGIAGGLEKIVLNAGSYTLMMTDADVTYGSATLYTFALNPEIKKWWYGGGIRIKQVGYFTQADVPQDHYRNVSSTAIPSREVVYSYNFFDDSNKSSGSLNTDAGAGNDLVRYKNVTVTDSRFMGRTEYTFSSNIDYPMTYSSMDYRTGKLMNKKVYNSENTLQLESQYLYQEDTAILLDFPGDHLRICTGWMGLAQVLNKEYFPSGVLQTKEEYAYNANKTIYQKQTYTSRSSEILKLKYFYDTRNSEYSKNRNEPERVEQYMNDDLLSVAKTVYSNSWTNPQGTATVNVAYMPQYVQTAKEDNSLETKSRINLYDQYGHPLEVQVENGNKKCMIWGYNNTCVIAEIENISYSAIPGTLITDAQDASNGGDEAVLLTKLAALRNASQLSASFITTYTYKPLVGVLSVTDPRGYKMTYEYDVSNRLKLVKDQDGNILTENQYHNKPN